jgi:thioredoxin reductase
MRRVGSVFHCPFCHCWEVRDQPLAALAAGERGVHLALLLRGWSDDVVLVTDGPAGLDADGRARLATVGVVVDERPVAELLSADGELTAVAFAGGSRPAGPSGRLAEFDGGRFRSTVTYRR